MTGASRERGPKAEAKRESVANAKDEAKNIGSASFYSHDLLQFVAIWVRAEEAESPFCPVQRSETFKKLCVHKRICAFNILCVRTNYFARSGC